MFVIPFCFTNFTFYHSITSLVKYKSFIHETNKQTNKNKCRKNEASKVEKKEIVKVVIVPLRFANFFMKNDNERRFVQRTNRSKKIMVSCNQTITQLWALSHQLQNNVINFVKISLVFFFLCSVCLHSTKFKWKYKLLSQTFWTNWFHTNQAGFT